MAKYCRNCGAEISDESLFCPECKTYVKRDSKEKTSNVKWILIGVAIVILIIAAGIFMSNVTGKTSTSLTMISSSNLDSGTYQVLLKDKADNPLADRYITVEVDNATYTIKTNSEGIAGINLTFSGSHEVKSYFAGDGEYEESHTSDIVIM